ncbi:MAG: FAD-dependent oxidoreductase [Burkholderiaceae bacterium]|jgi:3-(3-hydroxy-phenyl)propionate hydroxylase|nr:FAD-dependent oxidoreductase [Burkholderiaceae bacterium]
MATYVPPLYPSLPRSDESAAQPVRHGVVIIGGGPVGLSAAIDFAQRGINVVLLDEDETVCLESRAIVWARRTMEIWDRLGCGERMIDKSIQWDTGRVLHGKELLFKFHLETEGNRRYPANLNLQQYYVEQYLVERAQQLPGIDLRWKNRVTGAEPKADHVLLTIETPRGQYALAADWVIATDGPRSPMRRFLGLEREGKVFQDRFLNTLVRMNEDYAHERWFWFDAPFCAGGTALLHQLPDDLFRIDMELGPGVDMDEEVRPERVRSRLQEMLGEQTRFTVEWTSSYVVQCTRLARFRHGRVIFAGDSAHQVSPYGARGGNSGVPDADNLCWKLALVMQGRAPESLLDSYDFERVAAADENLAASTKSTQFISPPNPVARQLRDATLELAGEFAFAREMIDSGRLSQPTTYTGSPLNTPDSDAFDGGVVPGAPAEDAPVKAGAKDGWFLRSMQSGEFAVLYYTDGPIPATTLAALSALRSADWPVQVIIVSPQPLAGDLAGCTALTDPGEVLKKRYAGRSGTFYLFRPDQHVCARGHHFSAQRVRDALLRATGRTT